MSRDTATEYHREWLGLVQPVEGLVVSVPVLVDAQVMTRLPLDACERLRQLAERRSDPGALDAVELESLLSDELLLAFRPEDFDRGEALPPDLFLWVPEGRQEIRPTLALRRKTPPAPPESAAPAAAAGAAYQMLVWRLPEKLDFDRSETVTGSWDYPPAAKFERLLRHARVPIGLLANGKALRLVYAPHGESSGWITFQVANMASVGGRAILDALVMLVGRASFFGRPPEARLPALLEESRKRQAEVTTALAAQVFGALELLLAGFEAAAERDGGDALDDALRLGDDPLEGDHLYGGLLTVLLRLVFLLYAEDRGLVPVENELYAENFSVLGLFGQLQNDAGEFPDSMDRRFGAWDRLIALFRMVWLGAEHDAFHLPARGGRLFDPNRYPFLEGWPRGGSAPVNLGEERAKVKVPSIDDGTVYRMLRQLIVLDGQKLSYKALDVEQIGSVYEGLMGYHVVRLATPAICLKENGFWLEPEQLAELPANRRQSWLQDEVGLSRSDAKKLNEALPPGSAGVSPALLLEQLAPFRKKGSQVATAGRLVLQPGSERRRTSSHYTPRSLSGPIVKRTLEPLLAAIGEEPPSERLLELKICDPAMGSGAFLVEACRFLADQVVAAWTREGRLELIASAHEDVVNHARRLVAQRCLYGVDKNRFAVDLAKLSLWLETLAKDLPFTFLDHALRWGDSLVGLDFRQLRGFHWQPEAQETLASRALDEALSEAIALRQKILDLAGEGEDAQKEKEDLLRDADDALAHARLIGDLVVGAFFAGNSEKERKIELAKRLTTVNEWLQEGGGAPPVELRQMQREILERLPVFHWMLELPEVFFADRPDPLDGGRVNHAAFIDAFIGNPPFMGGKTISTNHGDEFSDWLETIHGAGKNGDLSAHFFRLADRLLGQHGAMGFIATNTIAQGDTRTAGLQPLVRQGLRIYDATRTLSWPGEAAVTVSVAHLAKGKPGRSFQGSHLDGKNVTTISSRLRAQGERVDPERLISNRGIIFQGAVVLGTGFILTPHEKDTLIASNQRNEIRIRPYLGGEDLNTSPEHKPSRAIIDFEQMSLGEASQWPVLLEIVRNRVKPERDRQKRQRYQDFWWQFAERQLAPFARLGSLPRCLVNSQVSKHLVFAFQPTDVIFAHTLYICALDCFSSFGVLQSRIHDAWARLLSSSMKTDLRYTAGDCFENFPFPQSDPREGMSSLEAIGERFYQVRANYLIDTQQGLTTCYNRLKDPREDAERVLELRRLHEDLDRTVLEAYGWSDIEVPPYETPETEEAKRRLESFEDEIIDRLFVLNAQRAEEERRLGLAAAGGGAKVSKKTPAGKRKGSTGHEGQGGLF